MIILNYYDYNTTHRVFWVPWLQLSTIWYSGCIYSCLQNVWHSRRFLTKEEGLGTWWNFVELDLQPASQVSPSLQMHVLDVYTVSLILSLRNKSSWRVCAINQSLLTIATPSREECLFDCIWSIYVLSCTYINGICWLELFLSRTAQLPTKVSQMSTNSIKFH